MTSKPALLAPEGFRYFELAAYLGPDPSRYFKCSVCKANCDPYVDYLWDERHQPALPDDSAPGYSALKPYVRCPGCGRFITGFNDPC